MSLPDLALKAGSLLPGFLNRLLEYHGICRGRVGTGPCGPRTCLFLPSLPRMLLSAQAGEACPGHPGLTSRQLAANTPGIQSFQIPM